MPQLRSLLLLLVGIALALGPRPASSATWSVEATASDEWESEKTDEGTRIERTIEQSYKISYEQEINPALRLSLDLTLDVSDEIKKDTSDDPDFDTREVTPGVEFQLQAVWWELTGDWEQTQESTDDPDEQTTVDTIWDVEYLAEPPGEVLPSFKARYQRDRTEDGGKIEQIEKILESSLDYKLWNLLEVSLDAKKEITDERFEADSDTEDREVKVDAKLTHDFTENLKFETQWISERRQSLTVSDDEVVLTREDTLDNEIRSQLTYEPIQNLELTLDREIEWSKDLELGPLEVTDTWTGEVSYAREITKTIDLDLSYVDEREDTRGTTDDSYRINREYTAGFEFAPLTTVSLTPTFERRAEIEWFDDRTKPKDDTIDDRWEVELDTKIWEEQIELIVTRTLETTTEQGVRSSNDRNWDVELNLTWKRVPNLEVAPQFTFTEDEDVLKGITDKEREIEVGLKYELTFGRVFTAAIDHIYTRTSKEPGDAVSTIQREDDTEITLEWAGFLKGMSLELGLIREASDESRDDKKPEIDYTYSVTYEWEFLRNYVFSVEYEYEDRNQSPNTRNLLTTFTIELLNKLLTVNLEYEIDQQLQEDRRTNHRYLIELEGKL